MYTTAVRKGIIESFRVFLPTHSRNRRGRHDACFISEASNWRSTPDAVSRQVD